jgi:Helicase associated domain
VKRSLRTDVVRSWPISTGPAQGNCQVPASHMTDDGFRLGTWVARQRARKHKTSPDRRQRLEALPGWSWDPFSDQWEEGFSHPKQFSDLMGNCRVSVSYNTDGGFRLMSGSRSRKPKSTWDTLIVVNASRRYQVGCGKGDGATAVRACGQHRLVRGRDALVLMYRTRRSSASEGCRRQPQYRPSANIRSVHESSRLNFVRRSGSVAFNSGSKR